MEREPVTDAERLELQRRDQWWERPLVVIDTETTSADPLEARIVQVACLAIYPDGRLSPLSYQAIVNPGVHIPDEVAKIHGIDDARAQTDGIPLADALYQVLRRLDRWNRMSPVVIYNAVYDWPLLWEELGRTDLCWTDPLANAKLVDPLVIEREFNGVAQGNYAHKLGDVARRYHLSLEQAHDALHDAIGAAQILREQVRCYDLVRKIPLDELYMKQRSWYATWRDQLNAHWRRKGVQKEVLGEWPFGNRQRVAP